MSVPIYQRFSPYKHVDHAQFLAFMASCIKPNIYVEYGVDRGHVLTKVSPHCQQAWGVDLSNHISNNDIPFNVTMHICNTRDFKQILLNRNATIDMAFIDADHRSNMAYQDFVDLYPHLIDDGFIFLHDTYPTYPYLLEDCACSDSWKVPHMIKQNYPQCEVLTLPFCPGITIVRKNTFILPWMVND